MASTIVTKVEYLHSYFHIVFDIGIDNDNLSTVHTRIWANAWVTRLTTEHNT